MRLYTGAMALIMGLSFGMIGCKGGSGAKCEKAVDKMMEIATQMAQAMGGDKVADAKKEMDAKKPEAIKKCEEALKNDKDGKIAKALDCIIDAKDLAAMSQCEGAQGMMQ